MLRSHIARAALTTLILSAGLLAAARFDLKVRNDFFAGFSGDREAFGRGMKASEEMIAADPAGQDPVTAEALSWHGSGLSFMAGAKFQQGDFQAGAQLWEKGLAEMDRAGQLQPDNIGVLIPRAAAWFAASRNMPKDQQKPLIEKAVADYEHVYQIQKDRFDALPTHNKSELLFGLADGHARLENTDKARGYFEKLASLGVSSGHLQQAKDYLASGKYTVTGAGCVGCHVDK